jgi:hypothetical protein
METQSPPRLLIKGAFSRHRGVEAFAGERKSSVLHDLTPDTFEVKDADTSQRVVLRCEDQEEALRRSLPGKRSTEVKGADRIR